MSLSQTKTEALPRASTKELFKAYTTLTKPRVNALLLFTAYMAMIVADHGLPNPMTSIVLLVGLGLSAGGAAAINMWYDRDIDQIMSRTLDRPIPQGIVSPNQSLVFGLILQALSLMIFLTFGNTLTAMLSFAGFIYYSVIYTMVLKRRTPQNIVIGGGAGSFPPLIGWALVTDHVSLVSMLMFLVIFFWTPSHFWALAIYKNEDYKKANVPMMPVVRGERYTRIQALIYTIVLAAVSMILTQIYPFHSLFFWFSCLLNLMFLYFNVRLLFEKDGNHKWAKRTFLASLVYLPAIFIVMAISACLI